LANPCISHGCSRCCRGTEMDLTKDDIARIEAAGHLSFYRDDGSGPQLRNVDGRCFFLDGGGRCTIYAIRPWGCRLYPLVLDMEEGLPTFDDLCPHAGEFPVDPDDVSDLLELVDTLEEEWA